MRCSTCEGIGYIEKLCSCGCMLPYSIKCPTCKGRKKTLKKRTLGAILRLLADEKRPNEIVKRVKSLQNAQQVGAIITNACKGIYDDEFETTCRKIRHLYA